VFLEKRLICTIRYLGSRVSLYLRWSPFIISCVVCPSNFERHVMRGT
jgi:hypothetical protein